MTDEISKPTVDHVEPKVLYEVYPVVSSGTPEVLYGDEISKPVEENIITETPVPEATISEPVPILVTNHSSLEPNSTPEPVVEPVVIPEAQKTQQEEANQITPPADSHLPLAGEENSESIVSSLPARGELGEGTQVQGSLRSFDKERSNERTVPVREMPEAEGVAAPVYSSNPKLNYAALAFISYMGRTKETLALANKKRKEYMMKRVYKIMDMFKKKNNIKNDDVEKFLHVSDDTATKYLNILVNDGKLKKQGKRNSTNYTKI